MQAPHRALPGAKFSLSRVGNNTLDFQCVHPVSLFFGNKLITIILVFE